MEKGQTTGLHHHNDQDGYWMVLAGKARFSGEGDTHYGDLGPMEGIFMPRYTRYSFESIDDEPLQILRVSQMQTGGREGPGERAGHTERGEAVQLPWRRRPRRAGQRPRQGALVRPALQRQHDQHRPDHAEGAGQRAPLPQRPGRLLDGACGEGAATSAKEIRTSGTSAPRRASTRRVIRATGSSASATNRCRSCGSASCDRWKASRVLEGDEGRRGPP